MRPSHASTLFFTLLCVDAFLLALGFSVSGSDRPKVRSSHLMSVSASKTGGRLIESVADYEEHVTNASERPVLVFYTAPWCGPCRLSIPVVKDVMKQFGPRVEVAEVNTDDLPDVAANAGVVSIPTIHICVGGKIVDTIIGCVAKGVLASSVEKVLEDMESGNPKKSNR